MAEQNTVFRGPNTEEAFYADKLSFWAGVNKGTLATIVFMAVLLIVLAVVVY